jgi:hypothetical protein
VRERDQLSGTQMLLWSALGLGAGLVAGFVLSEWVGGVNPTRVRGVARRLREGAPARLSRSASARAVEVALRADPRLAGLELEAVPVARGVVELRGWVPTRMARAVAGRSALSAPGIDSIINSILVRGEDDLARPDVPRATDQSA